MVELFRLDLRRRLDVVYSRKPNCQHVQHLSPGVCSTAMARFRELPDLYLDMLLHSALCKQGTPRRG